MYVVNVPTLHHMLEHWVPLVPSNIKSGRCRRGGEAPPQPAGSGAGSQTQMHPTTENMYFLKDLYSISVCVHLCVCRFVNM